MVLMWCVHIVRLGSMGRWSCQAHLTVADDEGPYEAHRFTHKYDPVPSYVFLRGYEGSDPVEANSALSLWEIELAGEDVTKSGGPIPWDRTVVNPGAPIVTVAVRLRHTASGRYLVTVHVSEVVFAIVWRFVVHFHVIADCRTTSEV
jgi:hypothetical protein